MYTKFLEQAREIVAKHRAEYAHQFTMFGGGTSSSSSSTDPWAGQQQYLTQGYQSAANLYNDASDYPQYYQSSTVTPFNSGESSAISGIENTGMNGSSALNSAGDALTQYNNGSMLSAQNPYFQSVADATAASVAPQIESQFTQGNAQNNPAMAYATSQGLGNAIGQLSYNNYNQQSQNQLNAAGLSTNQYNAQLAGQNAALTAGQAQQTQDQNTLSDQVNRYNYNQQLPYQMLNEYQNSINGNVGSTSTVTNPYSKTASTLGTLGSLASLAAMF